MKSVRIQSYSGPNFVYNSGHNILELSIVLVYVRVSTNKAKLDIQYDKIGIRVASQVAERLKTEDSRKLGNVGKISNSEGHSPVVSLPSEIKLR